jgi:hypothetical protein
MWEFEGKNNFEDSYHLDDYCGRLIGRNAEWNLYGFRYYPSICLEGLREITLKTEAARSSETMVSNHNTKQRSNSENHGLLRFSQVNQAAGGGGGPPKNHIQGKGYTVHRDIQSAPVLMLSSLDVNVFTLGGIRNLGSKCSHALAILATDVGCSDF